MTWGAVSSDHWAGDTRLTNSDSKETFLSEARAASLLWVELEAPRAAVRGRLCLFIEGAIERALDARGAPPPARPSAADRDEVVTDQIRRAIVSGADGIAVWLASLDGIVGPDRSLDTGDSATIRWWLRAAGERPIRIRFDAANLALGVYLEPRTLGSLLADTDDDDDDATLEGDDAPEDTTETLGDLPPEGERTAAAEILEAPSEKAEEPASSTCETSSSSDLGAEQACTTSVAAQSTMSEAAGQGMAERARAMAEEIAEDSDTGWLRHALIELSTPEPVAAAQEPEAPIAAPEPEQAAAPVPNPDPVPAPIPESAAAPMAATPTPDDPSHLAVRPLKHIVIEPPQGPQPPPIDEPLCEPAIPRLELRLAEEPEQVAAVPAAADAENKRKLEVCWRELSSATGPKPLTVVERLFASAYMPLRAALDRGVDMPALRETADDWSQSFEKSYRDGFDALRVRNKRPAMVVDVPDIALRVARLHGARATQLLLVDSMRFDIGEMVNDRIRALVGQRAACAERFLLWAALPTTTTTQVELIGRGPAGLREPITTTSDELLVGRGRKAQMIRRLKTGHRELLKLDIVAARLAEPGPVDAPGRFESIADEVAQRIAAHFEGLQPRTLVMLFGDHGFSVQAQLDGHRNLTEGGASPEEVMVPAFAWLVGAVH